MRKAITVAALILALGILAPVGALGKAKGTDRPWKVYVSGNTTRDLLGGTWTSSAAGQMSHLGKVTLHAGGTFTPAGSGVAITGTITTVAANGDEVTGTLQGTSTHLSPSGEIAARFVVTITGGTGRFKDASGTLNVEEHGVLDSLGTTLVTHDRFTGKGWLSY